MENNEDLNEIMKEFGAGSASDKSTNDTTPPKPEEPAFQPPPRRPKKKPNTKKIVLISVITVLAVILLAITAAFLYADYILGLLANSGGTEHSGDPTYDPWATTGTFETFYTFPTGTTEDLDPTGTTTGIIPTIPTDPTGGTDPTNPKPTTRPTATQRPSTTVTTPPSFPNVPPIEMGESILNIMLLGLDAGGKRSDTMMLCTINTRTKTITLTSFMRDLLVTVPGKTENTGNMYKLNAAYAMGGRNMLEATILYNFGVQIHEFVSIRMDKFPQLIDYVGGVDVKITSDEAAYFNKHHNWNIEAGVNHLDGERALKFARMRKLDSDHQRVARQQRVIEAIFKAYKDKGIFELNSLMLKILNADIISTTMTKDELWGYAGTMFPMLSGFSMERKKVPDYYWTYDIDGDGKKDRMYKDDYYKGQAVLVPNLDICRKYLESILNP